MGDSAAAVLERLRFTVMRPLTVPLARHFTTFRRPFDAEPIRRAGVVSDGRVHSAGRGGFSATEQPPRNIPEVGPRAQTRQALQTRPPLRLAVSKEPAGIASMQPERRLVAAVLYDAVLRFRKYGIRASERNRRLFAEVEAWFAADDADWPFSFVNVCDALGLSPDRIRQELYRLLPEPEPDALDYRSCRRASMVDRPLGPTSRTPGSGQTCDAGGRAARDEDDPGDWTRPGPKPRPGVKLMRGKIVCAIS